MEEPLVIRTLASLVLVLVAGTAPVAHAAPSRDGRALDVLVVGDSYSAGNGATGTTYGPAGCYRNTTHWSERYAAGLRDQGYTVRLANHACSGGRTPDVHTPRAMDTQSGRTTAAPAGVTTAGQADAYLRDADPCNTRVFPDEEFWTYRATSVSGGSITYDCTRTLRPQAHFVTADTDLVVLTMGGNDAGFSTIVQGCFVVGTRSASACRSAVDHARALVPAIKQRLLDDVAALRAHGLREDAKIVQLGYPWLQLDNGFTLPDPDAPLTPYPAGDAVRSLISDATAELATLPAAANVGHPGQMTFVDGVTTAFSGHEPDAQVTNPQTWINQAFSGADTNLWYHPNDLGQAAYARLLLAHGTFGAAAPATTPPPGGAAPTATLRVRPTRHRFARPGPVVVRVRTRLSDGTVPSGRLVVRVAGHREPVTRRVLEASANGRLRLRVRGLRVGRHRLVVVYRDRIATAVTDRVRVRVVPPRG
jgi:lysophospholipase L1-like esterase